MLVSGNILNANFLRTSDHVGQWIPPPQAYDFSTHCNELSLINTNWDDFGQARKGMEKREWYGEEGSNDGEALSTGWVVDVGTILGHVHMKILVHVIPIVP